MASTSQGFPLQRQSFGINSVSAINRTTGLPYGMAAIVGDGSLALTASSVDNRGGSSLFPRATEITEIDSQFTFNLKTWPDWIFEVFFGASVSTTAASATTGTVSALTNEVGTSVFDSTTGVATATLKTSEEANMKSDWFAVVAASATTVDVYKFSDFQNTRGTDLFFDDDTLKITTSPLTIVDAGASPAEIPGTGIELTGGSGTIAMTAGDVAYFQVSAPHGGLSDIDLGQTGLVFPEHELEIVGKERGSGETVIIRCYKCQAVSGITIPLNQSDFASTDIAVKVLQDDCRGKVATIRYAAGTATC
jgi:hypothetical protein